MDGLRQLTHALPTPAALIHHGVVLSANLALRELALPGEPEGWPLRPWLEQVLLPGDARDRVLRSLDQAEPTFAQVDAAVGGTRRRWQTVVVPCRGDAQTDSVLFFGVSDAGAEFERAAYWDLHVQTSAANRQVLLANQQLAQRARELERKQAELERKQAELERLSTAIEHVAEVIVITDREGRITFVNPVWEELTGYSAAESIGARPSIVKSGEHDGAFYRELWSTITAGSSWTGRFHNRRKNGEIYVEEATISPILDGTGEVTHFVAVKRDITQRLREEARQAQRAKLEGIGQLAAGIAHEINTPIQYISDNTVFLERSLGDLVEALAATRAALFENGQSGALDGLRQIVDSAQLDYVVREAPTAIRESLEGLRQIASIVNAMREFSHACGGELQAVDLNHVLESALLITRNEWRYVAEVEAQFQEGLPAIPGYPDEISQVFLNLIVNAAHAIAVARAQVDGPAAKGTIRLATRSLGEMVEVTIADNGTGIPDAIRSRIFDPFFTTKPVGQGAGQGLGVVHSIVVSRHQGQLDVESQVGVGTEFRIRLPLEAPPAADAPDPDSTAADGSLTGC